MNIHIDKDSYLKLLDTVIVSSQVGSHLYGLHNDNSDKDIIYVCGNFSDNHHSIVKMHHQYQYKESGIDHLFVDIQTFMNNLLKGDSTINFEVIFSDTFKNSELKFLYDNRFLFYNYQLIKSYLGFAKRDLKIYKKENNIKKVFHAQRGYETALKLYYLEEYSNDLSDNRLLYELKNNIKQVDKAFIEDLDNKIGSLRNDLNKRLEQKQIERIIKASDLEFLDSKIIELSKKHTIEGKFTNLDYYASYQADVQYDKQ